MSGPRPSRFVWLVEDYHEDHHESCTVNMAPERGGVVPVHSSSEYVKLGNMQRARRDRPKYLETTVRKRAYEEFLRGWIDLLLNDSKDSW